MFSSIIIAGLVLAIVLANLNSVLISWRSLRMFEARQANKIRIYSPVLPKRTCTVSVRDNRGVFHAVDVVAESVFEAAALALDVLRKDTWTDPIGASTPLQVEVREPVTKHTVTLLQIQRWVEGSASPKERIQKNRIRTLLENAELIR